MILKVEPGGWGAEKASPAEREDVAVSGVQNGDPQPPPQRGDRRALETRIDRRLHGGAGLRVWHGQDRRLAAAARPTARSDPPGRPARRLFEGLLEAVHPDRRIGGEASAG